MAYRPRGKAEVNPEDPRAFAVCGRCYNLWNHYKLSWQHQWVGNKLQNKWLLVCPLCLDKPSEFLRQIIIPPDPLPVNQPRMENYAIDEAGGWAQSMIMVFTASGTFNQILVPVGFNYVKFMLVGGGGAVGSAVLGDGLGGGAFSQTNSIRVSANTNLFYHVGAPGESSWARMLIPSPPTSTVDGCLAAAANGRIGGLASACVGDIRYSGGNGRAGYGGGGGGAAGIFGAGLQGGQGGNQGGIAAAGGGGGGSNGGLSTTGAYPGASVNGGAGGAGTSGTGGGLGGTVGSMNGGAGSLGGGGGGGYASGVNTGTGGAGGSDTTTTAAIGSGGGGGGAGWSTTQAIAHIGGAGGLYGGGGGGSAGGATSPQGPSAGGYVVAIFS